MEWGDRTSAWLLSCRFDPAKDPSGAPVAVKIVQPFVFKPQ
jgi:hypothetical protein